MKLVSLMLVRQSWKFEAVARKQQIVPPQFLHILCNVGRIYIRLSHLTKENTDREGVDPNVWDSYLSTQYLVIFYLFKKLRFLSPEEYHSSYHSYYCATVGCHTDSRLHPPVQNKINKIRNLKCLPTQPSTVIPSCQASSCITAILWCFWKWPK